MPGDTATILNVILEFPPEKPMRVHLPHLFKDGNNLKAGAIFVLTYTMYIYKRNYILDII